jgi:outer membrane receptor protein involved in Fe transport
MGDKRSRYACWSARCAGTLSGLVYASMLAPFMLAPFALGAQAPTKGAIASSAKAAPELTARVTINVTRAPLIDVISLVAQQAGLVSIIEDAQVPKGATVTLHVTRYPVQETFRALLHGTGLVASFPRYGVVTIGPASAAIAGGSISGFVTDDVTRRPVAGATILLDDATRGVQSGNNGRFVLSNVPAGNHTVTVRRIGYTRVTRPVTVTENGATTVDVALRVSVNALDQVVVTGTVVTTELKAVPSAITVITAKELEERGITQIQQLFRGDVPGLFSQNSGSNPNASLDEVTMFSRGATALSPSSAGISTTSTGISFLTNPIKTYIDGVEMADPKYLSQIDPRSIERIEILTGPQASTIYGSNAINGVMQVFTKRGSTPRPQLTLNLQSGWIENDFSSSHTPQHSYNASVNGVDGHLSYNIGGSWDYTGPWTPAKQTARVGAFGGVRIEFETRLGRATADMTLRRSRTQNEDRGSATHTISAYAQSGWYLWSNNNFTPTGFAVPATRSAAGQTLGLTLGYAPTSWWSHELGLGQDVLNTERHTVAPGYRSGDDTTLSLQNDYNDRRSLRYATTLRAPLTSLANATVTVGGDGWQDLTSSVALSLLSFTGTLADVFNLPSISRRPLHNAGAFLQTQLALRDRLFLTYGLRAEWNPNFGAEALPNYAPRYGIAYTQDVGAVTAKLRASYGRSTRPPAPGIKVPVLISNIYGASRWPGLKSLFEPYYGNYNYYLANPELGPEHQQGGEGGLELYFGRRASLVVTRYNQTVDELITPVLTDSLRSSTLCPAGPCVSNAPLVDGYGYVYQYTYLNVASIRSQGWELQGSTNIGPFSARATYSWTKSRTIGANPKYQSFFTASSYPQYQRGATFKYLPEHTWATGLTYNRAGTTIGLNLTGTGQITNFTSDQFLRSITSSIRLPQNRFTFTTAKYVHVNEGYAMADLNASKRFSSRIDGILQIQNLADFYENDFRADYATMGRQSKVGLRIRVQ